MDWSDLTSQVLPSLSARGGYVGEAPAANTWQQSNSDTSDLAAINQQRGNDQYANDDEFSDRVEPKPKFSGILLDMIQSHDPNNVKLEDIADQFEQYVSNDCDRRTSVGIRQEAQRVSTNRIREMWRQERASNLQRLAPNDVDLVIPFRGSSLSVGSPTATFSAALTPLKAVPFELAQGHLQILREHLPIAQPKSLTTAATPAGKLRGLTLTQGNVSFDQLQSLIDSFERYAAKHSSHTVGSHATLPVGYQTGWQIVRHLYRRYRATPCLTFDAAPAMSASDQAVAMMSHFSHQFRLVMIQHVREAEGNHSPSNVASSSKFGSYPLIEECVAYSRLAVNPWNCHESNSMSHRQDEALGIAASPLDDDIHGSGEPVDPNATLWPVLYFCLRCGDMVGALRVSQEMRESRQQQPTLETTDAIMDQILVKLAQVQGSSFSLWESVAVAATPHKLTTLISSQESHAMK
jgi:hypothetical protein